MSTLQHKSDNYEDFVKKFEQKKTTDDCYTPPDVYQAVLDFCKVNFPNELKNKRILRLFYPGGDYQKEDYSGAVVIDNPPFSIISQIVRWYNQRGIKYFLFAPLLTEFNIPAPGYVIVHKSTTYENGAKVATGFVSNMFSGIIGINSIQVLESRAKPKTQMPAGWETAATLRKYCKDLKPGEQIRWDIISERHRKTPEGKGVFGCAYEVRRTT